MRFLRFIVAGLTLAAVAPAAFGQAVGIRIEGAVDKRCTVAVPDFASAPELALIAKEMPQVLAYDLAFTGLFRMVPRQQYPPTFQGFTADAAQIDFDGWRATKVEFLVYAYVTLQGGTLVAECRMFDMASGEQVIGQRLMTAKDMPRLIAHRFSEEIVRAVDGVAGIATSRICFSAAVGSGNKEIFLADYDGYNATQLTRHGSISIKPKFSPDGARIAYLSYKDRYPFLYILDTSTGKSTPLSKNVGLNAAPAWSPDGRTLALVLSKDANTEIYIKNADGSAERRLTNNRASDTSPTFDPTGKQIAFVSDRGGYPQIYAMNVDGTNVRRLSYQGGRSYDPAWSPDGKRIAYVASRSGEGFEIYVMDADGGNPQRITNTPGSNESPSWSADSRHVICASTRTGRSELWAVNLARPHDQHRISPNNMTCQGPYWGPRRP